MRSRSPYRPRFWYVGGGGGGVNDDLPINCTDVNTHTRTPAGRPADTARHGRYTRLPFGRAVRRVARTVAFKPAAHVCAPAPHPEHHSNATRARTHARQFSAQPVRQCCRAVSPCAPCSLTRGRHTHTHTGHRAPLRSGVASRASLT